MGAVIGGAIGSVIGMKLRPKKEGFFKRLVKKAVKRKKASQSPSLSSAPDMIFQDEELKKIPHE